ncbi:histone H1-II-like [Humulus lupulus]|uniref:histone H1-II-like n=1 Tax=Humulus lupulus TaxID=3486 RepID=UPI002B40DB80|nr:histone H1-II-like [Humulus lupulus]
MMKYFQEAKLHGATLDEKTQVGIILNSLAPSFLTFTTNYFLNKLEYGMTQLLNELQIYEGINGGKSKGHEKKVATTEGAQGEANLASSSKSKKRKTRKEKKKAKKPAVGKAPTTKNPSGAKPTSKKAKEQCFHCKEEGALEA